MLNDKFAGAARVFTQDAGHAAGADLIDAVQRQPHGMLEDLLAHGRLANASACRVTTSGPTSRSRFASPR